MHAGHILIEGGTVYYVPVAQLPALRWHASQQRFRVVDQDEADSDTSGVTNAILRERVAQATAQKATSVNDTRHNTEHHSAPRKVPSSLTTGRWRDKVGTLARLGAEGEEKEMEEDSNAVQACIACEALYGVLPIGQGTSVLLYVTAASRMCELTLNCRTHEVYLVRRMEWLRLPTRHEHTSVDSKQGKYRNRDMSFTHQATEGVQGVAHTLAKKGMAASDASSSPALSSQPQIQSSAASLNRVGTAHKDEEEEVEEVENTPREDSDEPGCLPEATVRDYLAVVDRFCREMSSTEKDKTKKAMRKTTPSLVHSTLLQQVTDIASYDVLATTSLSSHLYLSSTLNLALAPHELMQSAPVPLDTMREEVKENSSVVDEEQTSRNDAAVSLSSVRVFQWNHMLLEAFELPTKGALWQWITAQQEADSCTSSDKEMSWQHICMPPTCPSTLLDMSHQPDKDENTEETEKARSSVLNKQAFCPVMLYMPCYMRGLVQRCPAQSGTDQCEMTLITRLSCRWAGTRYCRRGLEPCGSGVCANLAITSLYLTHRNIKEGGTDRVVSETSKYNSNESCQACRMAVYELVRGSVPRRWQQPADLSFKPTISFTSHASAAVEELNTHVRLLEQLLPSLRQLCLLDTTSASSKLERPLAAALMHSVHGLQAKQAHNTTTTSISNASGCGNNSTMLGQIIPSCGASATASVENQSSPTLGLTSSLHAASTTVLQQPVAVQYVKFDVGQRKKRVAYSAVREQLRTVLQRSNTNNSNNDAGHANDGEKDADVQVEGDGQGSSAVVTRVPWYDFSRYESDSKGGTTHQSVWRVAEVQSAYIRVNCLDCLDRTNLVQCMLAEMVLPHMLHYIRGDTNNSSSNGSDDSETIMRHAQEEQRMRRQLRQLFALQGIVLSHMYAESEPHFLWYVLRDEVKQRRLLQLSSAWHGARIALRRWYHQNFTDGRKQDAITLLTRQHEPTLFNSVVESPFSRDLTSMNREVFYGLLLAFAPLCVSVVLACLVAEKHERRLHIGLACGWLVYLAALCPRLMKYRLTYPNRSLLLYGVTQGMS